MDLAQIISVAGIGGILGSILTTFFQSWLNNESNKKNRAFQEKKEAYIGLLESYHQAAVTKSDKSALAFAYWQIRCDLVAPLQVRDAIQSMIDTNNNKQMRKEAEKNLKETLRKDLGILNS